MYMQTGVEVGDMTVTWEWWEAAPGTTGAHTSHCPRWCRLPLHSTSLRSIHLMSFFFKFKPALQAHPLFIWWILEFQSRNLTPKTKDLFLRELNVKHLFIYSKVKIPVYVSLFPSLYLESDNMVLVNVQREWGSVLQGTQGVGRCASGWTGSRVVWCASVCRGRALERGELSVS